MKNKLNKIFKLFSKRRDLLNKLNGLILDDNMKAIIDKYKISELPFCNIDNIVKLYNNAVETTSIKIKTDFSTGISPINDYYYLCLIAKSMNIKNYFEIGAWVGLSGYNIASNLGYDTNVYSLDIPFDHPEIQIFNIPKELFGHYSKHLSNVRHLKSDSKTFDYSEYKNKIDLVFVDGNHALDYVTNDTKIAFELLKDDKSVIAWHDYMILGEVNNNVLCGILETIPQSEHKHLYYLYQSNMAVYSKSFNFEPMIMPQWKIPDTNFEVTFNPNH